MWVELEVKHWLEDVLEKQKRAFQYPGKCTKMQELYTSEFCFKFELLNLMAS